MGQIQTLGFYWAGFLSMILAVLKLTIEGHWSWWRVLLPVWVVLGHNAVYIYGRLCLALFHRRWNDGRGRGGPPRRSPLWLATGGMLCFLIFADNVLRRIQGSGATAWFWLSSGRWEMIVAFGVLIVVCQLVFWSADVSGRSLNQRVAAQ